MTPDRGRNSSDRPLSCFGREVGKQVRREVVCRVARGDVKYARKITHSRTVIVLDFAGGEMAFLYSNATKEILSFLAPDAPEIADWHNSRAAARALFGPNPSHLGGGCA